MWICTHCHAENKDGYSACDQCGAIRSAGRFGSAPTALNNRQAPMPAPGASQPLHRYAAETKKHPPAAPAPQKRYMEGLGKAVGWALLVLLPVLGALLFWRQYDALSGALVPLLLPADADEIFRVLCYAGLGFVAVLVAMLPGLHTLMQCGRRPKKQK